ncbi:MULTISPECIES: type VII secretion protein EccB [unclassified Leifsonia]|uniref:type VII secretion protein EccB n=1 Tax=unclassified Leifsonia TaxID=2663824 RepID=UPI000700931A|nr:MULTISPECIES: type VII secretion protein EccB [unclassified Leifsonia]KQX05458.1 hypothetical protein ASC59_15145 [Leifsonia sp. Root1293]KRA09091.1 hypothetical protein ASD61_15140 [Leifsonia sp. Root60]
MATKKDLIEAQGFSRRRLLSAFTGGAPGGKELDPAKPLRAVVAGVALTAMVILGGVFYGLVRPGLPQGWEDNRLVLVSDTGARYLTVGGELHPVINTASARLLVPAGDFSVISTDQATVADITVGGTVGIVGAPDDLPAPDALISDGWTACVTGRAQTTVGISAAPIATNAPGSGTVVTVDDELFVVAGEYRYAIDDDDANAVLRAVGLGASAPIEVDGRWLNLFQPGEDLSPLRVEGTGDAIDGTDLRVGTVVHPEGSDDDERYIALASGELAKLTPLAYQLQLLGNSDGEVIDVSPAEIGDLPTATDPAGGRDWPTDVLAPVDAERVPCALSELADDAATTTLATAPAADVTGDSGGSIGVDVGAGSLVRTGPGAPAFLVDGSGTAYAVATTDSLERLGYAGADVAAVVPGWLDFLPTGPELSPEAAGASPTVEAASAQ